MGNVDREEGWAIKYKECSKRLAYIPPKISTFQ